MKVKVQLVYPDKKTDAEVEVADGKKGVALMNAIDKAVEKKYAEDKNWVRWNLVDVVE